MKRRGFTMLEILVLVTVGALLLIPLLTLSGRNVTDEQEILERTLAHGLCLDVLERLKHYRLEWPLPGGAPNLPEYPAAPPLSEMYLPVELDPADVTLFDQVYLDQMRALGMTLKPSIVRTPDGEDQGLFRLTVKVAWTDAHGRRRDVAQSRYCFAP